MENPFTAEELKKLAYIVGTSAALPEEEMKPIREKLRQMRANALVQTLKTKPHPVHE